MKRARETDRDRGESQADSRLAFTGYAAEWIERYQGTGRRGLPEHPRADYRRDLERYADEERAFRGDRPYAEPVSAVPFPEPSLTDGVVRLRPWRDEDAAVKVTWGQDAVIVRWSGVPVKYTEAAALARAAHTEEERKAGRMLGLAITDATSGVVLGSCDIRRPDSDDPALGEVGYLLSETARGRGVATRAMALLVDWSFRELGMERVQALVHPDNPASGAVLDRLGFECEGLLRRYRADDDGREDRFLYAVLPGDLVMPGPTTEA